MLSPAPLYNDLAVGPTNGTGHWVIGQDGVRIRIGVWNSGAKGTVLIFPGRTEYIEKYGGAARELSRHGYSSSQLTGAAKVWPTACNWIATSAMS